MRTKGNIYDRSVKQWNPFVGCAFNCTYCKNSFQRQLKRWAKNNCRQCYEFHPHDHLERLTQPLPTTKPGEFIFVCATGDINFASKNTRDAIMSRIRNEPSKTFLLQSKNPECFRRFRQLPPNVIIGTTIETDILTVACGESGAPAPTSRFEALLRLKHPRKMVSVEPAMRWNHAVMLAWLLELKPEFVYIGYCTVGSHFNEPDFTDFHRLVQDLTRSGVDTLIKTSEPRKPNP